MIKYHRFFLINLYKKAISNNKIRLLYYGELITGEHGFMPKSISNDYYKLASYAAAGKH